MASDQLIVSEKSDLFLDYLMRCAMTAPGAAVSETAGRIMARLLILGAIEGGDSFITPYLVPLPGANASFEVRTYRPGELLPTEVYDRLHAATALKTALRSARDGGNGIEVVSRTPSGLERCVLVRDSTGDFEFRFAAPETLVGDVAECTAAVAAWADLFDRWRQGVGRGPADLGTTPATGERTSTVAGRARDRRATSPPAAAAASAAVRTTQAPATPSGAGASGEGPAADVLAAAIQHAIANLVVEVDLTQVEQLIRRVLDDERKDMVEPLARRLSARIGESLVLPDAHTLVEAVSQVIPNPDDLAEAVAADVGALLSETLMRRRPGETGSGGDSVPLMAAIEQLHVRVEGLEDQFRKTAGMLHVLGEHLDVGDRRAAVAERVTIAVDHEMQRLANRIDEQVTVLAASAGGGSELSDGVARLTRKLRQSVTQLDRALERLNQVVDQLSAGDPARR